MLVHNYKERETSPSLREEEKSSQQISAKAHSRPADTPIALVFLAGRIAVVAPIALKVAEQRRRSTLQHANAHFCAIRYSTT